MEYEEFIKQREYAPIVSGFEADESAFPESMFDHQRAVVKWACRRGRAGVFMDTGLGKTITQLTWADQVCRKTGGYVLVLAPLAVAHQTVREADKFGLAATFAEGDDDISEPGVYVTNYEKLHRFTTDQFAGVVLDESSILKGMQGRVRAQITEFFSGTPYRLSCTATPSPNDFMELGTQSEFLGIMSQVEMLAMFFIHDTSGGTGSWRLKGHGKARFWEWLATWCVFLRSPADIGFDSTGYDLPAIEMHEHVIDTVPDGALFVEPALSLQERNQARRESVEDRCRVAAEIVNALDEPCAVWCNLNDEAALLQKLIPGSVNVQGSDSPEFKIAATRWFVGDDSLQSTLLCDKLKPSERRLLGWKTQSERLAESTCASITKLTGKNSDLKPLKSGPNTTKTENENTSPTQKCSENTEPLQRLGPKQTRRRESPKESKNTGLMGQSTTVCLSLKTGDAQFVDHQHLETGVEVDSTSIIATQPEKLEGCFAYPAITALENSKIQYSGLSEQSSTSKNRLSRVLISKPRMFGYGLNFQSSRHCVFVGLSDSWESYYQAIRRQWRFGQTKTVHCHIVSADTEGAVVDNIRRKDEQHAELSAAMMDQMIDFMKKEVFGAAIEKTDYAAEMDMIIPPWVS